MKEDLPKTYSITYDVRVEKEPMGKDQVKALDRGACDSILVVSVLHLDGQKSMLEGATGSAIFGICGTEDRFLNPAEKFQIWTLLAENLIDELPPGTRKTLCEEVIRSVKDMITVSKILLRKGEN